MIDGSIMDSADLVSTYDQAKALTETYSPAFLAAMEKAGHNAAWNTLMLSGIPETPNDVRSIVEATVKGCVLMLVMDGFLSLTDKALATDEEKAEQARQAASADQRMSALRDRLMESFGTDQYGRSTASAGSRPGNYL